jgi:hypothetical protein
VSGSSCGFGMIVGCSTARHASRLWASSFFTFSEKGEVS